MSEIKVLSTGLIYRNPKPYLRSVHAYFPSVVHLGGGEMLAAMVFGSAFEAVDCHTEVARSLDDGQTWTLEGPLDPRAPHPGISDIYKIAWDGREVIAFGAKYFRDNPDEGLTNPANVGFCNDPG